MAAKGRKQRQVRETAARYVPAPKPGTHRASITSKGQVVIPAALRKKYDITPETRLLIADDGEHITIKPIDVEAILKRLRGSLAGTGTMEEYLAEKKKEIEREDAKFSRTR
jgi:AbrB family looped-hinge helix DNA binding protein